MISPQLVSKSFVIVFNEPVYLQLRPQDKQYVGLNVKVIVYLNFKTNDLTVAQRACSKFFGTEVTIYGVEVLIV